jgi:hypothetical protein
MGETLPIIIKVELSVDVILSPLFLYPVLVLTLLANQLPALKFMVTG